MARITRFVAVLVVASLAFPVFAKEKDDDLENEPEVETGGAPASKILEKAKKLYKKGDYYTASIEFNKVVKGETGDSAGNKQKAEFFLGKTLYQMGYYAASLAAFDAIVQEGQAHAYYRTTLKWLAALSRVLPESSGVLEKIGQYPAEQLSDPVFDKVRPELYYLLGRHNYLQGTPESLKTAIELFKQVPEDSEFFLESKFLEGVSWVLIPNGEEAVNALRQIIIVAKEPSLRKKYKKAKVREFEELAYLTMARVFFSTQQYDISIKYFELIPQRSPDWVESLFEASWAYFLRTPQLNGKALGNIHTLNAPYFEDQLFPESTVLKAQIYYNYCRYDGAQEALDEFTSTYPPMRKKLREIVQMDPDDDSKFYEFIKKVRDNTAGLEDATQRMVMTALGDKTLLKTFAYVDELDKEIAAFDKSDKAWQTTQIAIEVKQDLVLQKSNAEEKAGKLARQRLQRLEEEVTFLISDANGIRVAILDAQEQANITPPKDGKGAVERPHVDDEHQTWNFDGEYWLDELGFYRYVIGSKCPKKE